MAKNPEIEESGARRGRSIDPSVVEAALAGDRTALEYLVRETRREAYGFAFRLARNHADAEDIVQEAYIKALRGLSSFRGEASFFTWLCRIIHNTFLNHRRSGARAEAAMGEVGAGRRESSFQDPSEGVVLEETRELLEGEIAGLPPRQKAALVLHVFHGQSFDEIAAVLETTRENVKVNVCLARKKLREALSCRAGFNAAPRRASPAEGRAGGIDAAEAP